MFLLYHAYVYLEFLILACTIYILASIGQLHKMGANIDFVSNRARIIGVTKLHGANVVAWDLRSGAGLVVAAAMADGKTRIEQENLIERGYENLVSRVSEIGIRAKKCL